MATTLAAKKREDKDNTVRAAEGIEALTLYKGPVADVVEEFCAGIQSGLSYCGGRTISEAREKVEFIRVAPSAKEREGDHTDHDWEGVSVESNGVASSDSQLTGDESVPTATESDD